MLRRCHCSSTLAFTSNTLRVQFAVTLEGTIISIPKPAAVSNSANSSCFKHSVMFRTTAIAFGEYADQSLIALAVGHSSI